MAEEIAKSRSHRIALILHALKTATGNEPNS